MGGAKMELEQVLEVIQQADDYQINEIINALTERYKRVFPDWEVVFLALPLHDPVQRKQTIEYVLRCEKGSLG